MSAIVVPLTSVSIADPSMDAIDAVTSAKDVAGAGDACSAVVLSFGLAKARRDHPSIRRAAVRTEIQ